MNLTTHYDAMRQAAWPLLAQGQPDLDSLLDDPRDDRRGITLLGRPPAVITEAITTILADFQQDEPSQYYYPAGDIHLTILSIIACYNGFALPTIDPAQYHRILHDVLRQTPPLKLTFAGLTASAGGIMVQGFPADEGLQVLRDQLRAAFRQSGLQQSIDQRYSIQTAHSTIIRFRHPLQDAPRLLRKLAAYEHFFIGTFEITELELVYNDWYQRAEHTILLEKYPLLPTS